MKCEEQLPFQRSDFAHNDFQYLEDLATAYWYSDILFSAIELNIFELIERETLDTKKLASLIGSSLEKTNKLLMILERLDLVDKHGNTWFISQICRKYLLKKSPHCMRNFLLYRKHMKSTWSALSETMSDNKQKKLSILSASDSYKIRNLHYVRAMGEMAKEKSRDILGILRMENWHGPVLDIGGGSGNLIKAILKENKHTIGTLFEIPEVIEASEVLHSKPKYWERITKIAGDFRYHQFSSDEQYGLVIMSNFLHAYGHYEAKSLLEKAAALLAGDGLMLIHDYYPDRSGRRPHKGALYDLNMLLNTFSGECHKAKTVRTWLSNNGLIHSIIKDLNTDSSVILASKAMLKSTDDRIASEWKYIATELGFTRAHIINPRDIITAPWVRLKCEFGCKGFGHNLQCPPYGLPENKMRRILNSYKHAILLEGSPPGRSFHKKLLEIEKQAFLKGFHKSLSFGAGPCPVCEECSTDGQCKYPERARPSMEASGVDVFGTAKKYSIELKPLKNKSHYVKYMGLLLLE